MGMNIKHPQVHAMARELAAQEISARKAALLDLLKRYERLRWTDSRSSAELQAELYDDDGLPL